MVQMDKSAEHFLRRVYEATTIPADKRSDLDFLRAAVMLAHSYAGAALSPLPSEAPADPMSPELPGLDLPTSAGTTRQ